MASELIRAVVLFTYMWDLEPFGEMTRILYGHDSRYGAFHLASSGGYSKEHRVELGGVDFSRQQFDPPQGLLPPFLYKLWTLVTNFADGAERDL